MVSEPDGSEGKLPTDVTSETSAPSTASVRVAFATRSVIAGDGTQTDRPVIDGAVIGKPTFRGSALQDVTLFVEQQTPIRSGALRLRLEAFNVFNHANVLGRQSVYGNGSSPNANFGQPAAGLANIDPPRMVQLELRYSF